MTAQPAVEDESVSRSECWCCGLIEDPVRMVHLGIHPEVTVCIRCAHWMSKGASEIEDQDRTGVLVHARDQFRQLRRAVVQRGWHHKRFIGRPLRWLGKHTP